VTVSRRHFLRAVAAAPLAPFVRRQTSTDIRIAEVRHWYEDFVYRAPYKFGGRVVDRVTLLNVRCRVTTQAGKTASGFDRVAAACHMLPESNYTNNVAETEILIPAHPGRGPVGPLSDAAVMPEAPACHAKEKSE
jgi:hypothetical protein